MRFLLHRCFRLLKALKRQESPFQPQLTVREKDLLIQYACKARCAAVEIGVLNGGSTAFLSKAFPNGVTLFAIDPYIVDSKDPQLHGKFSLAFLNVLFHGDIFKVRFIKNYSHRVALGWTRSIDFLWIDGSHHYEDVKKDFEEWSKFVLKGGHILFHDSNRRDLTSDSVFDQGWCGPTLFCQEIREKLCSQYQHVESLDSINVFRKL